MSASFKRRLLKVFDSYFEERGFERRSDSFYGDRYDRFISGGRQSLAVNYHWRKQALVLDPAFGSVRLDEVEKEVFRFEEKSDLTSEYDAFQRSTIGLRLTGNELFNIATNRYAVTTEDDCITVGRKYAHEMFGKAQRFWLDFSTPEAILKKLSDVPGNAREYAGTDVFAAIRAITLTNMLNGNEAAQSLAQKILSRLSGRPETDLSCWVERAFQEWNAAKD